MPPLLGRIALPALETLCGCYAMYAFCSGLNSDLLAASTAFLVLRGVRLAVFHGH